MSFIKRAFNTKIIVDFYTTRPEVFEFAKPMKSSKFFPEWWKKLPKEQGADTLVPYSTMKRCVGFTDLYKKGFVLPLWSDLQVSLGEINNPTASWQFADFQSTAIDHPQDQRGDYLPSEQYQHLKLNNPWYAKCSEDIDWAFIDMPWNAANPENIIMPTGIMNYHHQHSLNINLFFPRSAKPRIESLKYGQPLVQLIPLTERDVECRYHLISDNELHKVVVPSLWFTKKYHNIKAGRCPFKG